MIRLNTLAAAALIGLFLLCVPALGAQELSQPAGGELFATRWNVLTIDAKPLEPHEGPNTAHIVLDGKGRLSGSDGCNRLIGSYQLEGSSVHFGRVATTMMACLSGGADERRFLEALERVAHWRKEGRELSLLDAQGREVARFEAAESVPTP